MYITNSLKLDFKEYIENDIKIGLSKQNMSNVEEVNSLLINIVGSLVSKSISNFIIRKDYYVFSIYTVDVLGEEA